MYHKPISLVLSLLISLNVSATEGCISNYNLSIDGINVQEQESGEKDPITAKDVAATTTGVAIAGLSIKGMMFASMGGALIMVNPAAIGATLLGGTTIATQNAKLRSDLKSGRQLVKDSMLGDGLELSRMREEILNETEVSLTNEDIAMAVLELNSSKELCPKRELYFDEILEENQEHPRVILGFSAIKSLLIEKLNTES